MRPLIESNDFYNEIDDLTCGRHAAVPAAWSRKRLEPVRIVDR